MADTARQVLGILGSRAACLVLSVLTSAVIARSLEPEGRGVYYMAVTVATTATMLGHLSGEQAQSALWTDAGAPRGARGQQRAARTRARDAQRACGDCLCGRGRP